MPKHAKYPGQGKQTGSSIGLTQAQRDAALRISTQVARVANPTIADGAQWAIDATAGLNAEQCAWLAEYGDTAKALADAVQQAIDMERAEAEAEALAPTYNGGRW